MYVLLNLQIEGEVEMVGFIRQGEKVLIGS